MKCTVGKESLPAHLQKGCLCQRPAREGFYYILLSLRIKQLEK